MRRRGPRGGPVRLRRSRREAAPVRREALAPARSSAAPSRPAAVLLRRGARLRDLDLHLLDARRLARQMAEVIELGATHAATTHDADVGEHGAVEGEDA